MLACSYYGHISIVYYYFNVSFQEWPTLTAGFDDEYFVSISVLKIKMKSQVSNRYLQIYVNILCAFVLYY